MKDDLNETRAYASPACLAHELDEAWLLDDAVPVDRPAVMRWRKAARERLIAMRLAVPVAERVAVAREIAGELDTLIEVGPGTIVGAYWPFRGEPDLRDWLGRIVEKGGRTALPVVAARGQPLVFREWTPKSWMRRGVWRIPEPTTGAELKPNIVVVPLVGYDLDCYRLGYGGGYFDRTLAALETQPLVIGVGHAFAAMPTIHPLAHDIPMDVIVTGSGAVIWRDQE